MQELPQERLTVGIGALASAEAALQWTLDYTRERKAFGKSVADFQNTRFKLAEMATEIQVGRVRRSLHGAASPGQAGRTHRRHVQVLDDGPAMQGARRMRSCTAATASCGNIRWRGPGPMPVQRIYAGTNEIMKEIIARAL